MNVSIEDLVELSINYNLSLLQCVWVLYLNEGKEPPAAERDMYMTKKEWDELKGRNIIGRDRQVSAAFVQNALKSLEKKRTGKAVGTLMPQIDPVLDKIIEAITGILKPKPNVKSYERTLHRFDGNKWLTDMFYIWLYLFPTPGDGNESWQMLFGATYGKSYKLRVSSKGAITRFIKFAKKYDVGIYIVGTFLFIKDHIREDGECYIPKIDNYFKVDEEWYDVAAEMVDEAESYKDLLHIFSHKVDEMNSTVTHSASLM